jgi:23S rRNA (cytosine1962-C5)-methyltransferase
VLTAHEDGAAFEIAPGNGLSVGLYLDARQARARVKALAAGRTVLNLFAYTCGFGLAALRGGATRAVNLDLSRRVLDWGERNLVLNGFQPQRRDFIAGESFEWLRRFAKKGERFGLVILDPPSFATSQGARFSAAKDYAALVAAAAPVLESGGLLVACCNLETLRPEQFEAQALQGLGTAQVLDRFGASALDFAHPSALKVLTLAPRSLRSSPSANQGTLTADTSVR